MNVRNTYLVEYESKLVNLMETYTSEYYVWSISAGEYVEITADEALVLITPIV